jgi:hypothetical protein
MSIDFSKAPEGATHYYRGIGSVLWYCVLAGVVRVWGDSEWQESTTTIGALKPIPAVEPFVSVEDTQPTGSTDDPVNSPSHYASGGVECIEAIKASMSHEAFLGYLKGNVQKYLWRYEKKANPVEDLKKAQWYLARLTKEQEGE